MHRQYIQALLLIEENHGNFRRSAFTLSYNAIEELSHPRDPAPNEFDSARVRREGEPTDLFSIFWTVSRRNSCSPSDVFR